MIAFATGGLLGDVCLHLIPHAFLGESGAGGGDASAADAVRFVMVEEKRNIILGVRVEEVARGRRNRGSR